MILNSQSSYIKALVGLLLIGVSIGLASVNSIAFFVSLIVFYILILLLIRPVFFLIGSIAFAGAPQLLSVHLGGLNITIGEILQVSFVITSVLEGLKIQHKSSLPGILSFLIFGLTIVVSYFVGLTGVETSYVGVNGLKSPSSYGLFEIFWMIFTGLFYVYAYRFLLISKSNFGDTLFKLVTTITGVWIIIGLIQISIESVHGSINFPLNLSHYLLPRLYAFEDEPSMFAAYLMPLIPLVIYKYEQTNERKWLILNYLFITSIVLTFSTTGYIGLITFIIGYIFIRRNWSGILFLLIGLVLFMLAATMIPSINSVIIEQYYKLINPTSNYSSFYRLSIVTGGIKMFLSHPLFGVGTGRLQFLLYRFVPLGSFVNKGLNETNDVYIDILAEYGFIAFIAFVGFLYGLFNRLKGGYLKLSLIIMIVQFAAIDNPFRFEFWSYLILLLALSHDLNILSGVKSINKKMEGEQN